MRIVIVGLGLCLAACESAPKQAPTSRVVIQGDSYCRLAEKWRWDVRDTKPTIQQARRVNAKYDRTCGRKKSKPKTS
jgi:hypothetical protein